MFIDGSARILNGRPASNLQTGARVALIGMLINVVLASAKILGGLFGNAYVLIADGIESALDIAGSIVIWGGLNRCRATS